MRQGLLVVANQHTGLGKCLVHEEALRRSDLSTVSKALVEIRTHTVLILQNNMGAFEK